MPKSHLLNKLLANNKEKGLSENIWGQSALNSVKQALINNNIAANDEDGEILLEIENYIDKPYQTTLISNNTGINFISEPSHHGKNIIQIAAVKNVKLINWHGFHVVIQGSDLMTKPSSIYAPLWNLFVDERINLDEESNEELVFLGFDDTDINNYCHFILDYVTKNFLFKLKFKNISLILPDVVKLPFHVEVFFALKRIGVTIKSLAEGQSIRVSQLLYVAKNTAFSHPAFKASNWAIEGLHRLFPSLEQFSTNERILWLSRTGSRIIEDEQEIINTLRASYTVSSIDCGSMPIEDQVRYFNSHTVIIGPHGAAFTNIVFIQGGATKKVIEIFAEGNGIPTYAILAKSLGLNHYSYVCESKSTNHPNYPNMIIDKTSVISAIKSVIHS